MVGSCSVNFKIQLEALFMSYPQYCEFNPDTFPGLIFRMKNPKICLLIFASGKIVLTGAKTRQNIDEAFSKIQLILKEFIKQDIRVDTKAQVVTKR